MKGGCEFGEFAAMAQKLDALLAGGLDAVLDQTSRDASAALLSKLKKRTPVGKAPEFETQEFVGEDYYAQVKTKKGQTVFRKRKGRRYRLLTRSGEIQSRYWAGYTGGTLRRAWRVSREKSGNEYLITAENPTEYASYAEYGHRQTPGRYVPALGKRLKASWVNGKFMMKTSADEIAEQYPKAAQEAVDNALKEAFCGK